MEGASARLGHWSSGKRNPALSGFGQCLQQAVAEPGHAGGRPSSCRSPCSGERLRLACRDMAPACSRRACLHGYLLFVVGKAGERRRRPSGLRLSKKKPPVRCCSAGCRQSRWLPAITRPVSWLGPVSDGAHPRTKGARCFTGEHRHRVPSTRWVSWRFAAQACEAPGDPSQWTRDPREEARAERASSRSHLRAVRRARRCRRRRALGNPARARDVCRVSEPARQWNQEGREAPEERHRCAARGMNHSMPVRRPANCR